MKEFFANGKLLITGEYLVLNGAKSLAVPTHKGQKLLFTKKSTQILSWKSLDYKGKTWFEGVFSSENFKIQLLNGSIANINQDNIYNIHFKETEYDLSKFGTKTVTHPKIQELSSQDLLNCFNKLMKS